VIPVCIGYDPREAAVYTVLEKSLIETSSSPLAIIPLYSKMLDNFDGQQDATNAFIYLRFLVCHLMDFQGWAIYMDSDMLFRDDITKLWDMRDDSKAVMVVKHDYHTTQETKFINTPLEARNSNYPRKNWSSLILWNCGHPQNRILNKRFVSEAGGRVLHRFSWLQDNQIGHIHSDWNHLVGELPPNPMAKNVHYTLGAPGFEYYRDCAFSDEWHRHLLGSIHMEGEDQEAMVRRAKHV